MQNFKDSNSLKVCPSDQLPFPDFTFSQDNLRFVKDSIHNYVYFDKSYFTIIDTPEFQRLRDIKQLGSAYSVFPGAVHTRYEHSLGVGFIAQSMIDHFRYCQQQELRIEPRDIQNVVIAGLTHDLGHGVLSHVFDRHLIPKLAPSLEWDFKDASIMMLSHLIEQNQIEHLGEDDVKMINSLIKGEPNSNNKYKEKAWLFDIVANNRNQIDADKFDYIVRDCFNIGFDNSSFDPIRLIQTSRVINNRICYHEKNVHFLKTLFQNRYMMFKQVYCHRVCQAVDLMYTDVLTIADKKLKFIENLTRPEKYVHFTDNLIRYIENSSFEEFKEAQKIIERIRNRDLYKLASQASLDSNKELDESKIVVQDIVNCNDSEVSLREEDVILHKYTINYGTQDKNPIDLVEFYNSRTCFKNNDQKLNSQIEPQKFSERHVRLFVRDRSKCDAAQKAFEKYCKKFLKIETSNLDQIVSSKTTSQQNDYIGIKYT